MQVSRVIRQYGFEIKDVAKQMGLSESSLAKSISSTGNPSIGKLRKIAEIVGCDLADFFEDERKDYKETDSPTLQTTDKIKQIMKSKGLSISEVARRMGVFPSSLSRTLRLGGYRVETLYAITKAIGCDIKDIDDTAPEPKCVCPHCGKEIEASIVLHARN